MGGRGALGIDRRPLVAEARAGERAAIVSIPALGVIRPTRRARAVAVESVIELLRGDPSPRPVGPVRRAEHEDGRPGVRFVASRSRARVVAGMVRDNRPWRLVTRLSGALAAAIAIGAWGLISTTVWQLSDRLPAWRLALVMVFAIALMTVWLIADHGRVDRTDDRARRRLPVRRCVARSSSSTRTFSARRWATQRRSSTSSRSPGRRAPSRSSAARSARASRATRQCVRPRTADGSRIATVPGRRKSARTAVRRREPDRVDERRA